MKNIEHTGAKDQHIPRRDILRLALATIDALLGSAGKKRKEPQISEPSPDGSPLVSTHRRPTKSGSLFEELDDTWRVRK